MTARNGHSKGRKEKVPVDAYVPCQVEPGMFHGEYLVTFDVADPQNPEQMVPIRLLADEREVIIPSGKPERDDPVNGLLRVEVARKVRGLALIVLPQPAQPVGERAYVSEELLQRKPRHDPLRPSHRKGS